MIYNKNNQPYTVTEGDVLDILKTLPANSYDGSLCDPPYGLGFMGKDWDQNVPGVDVWQEMLRVCKPGSYLIAFGSPKTFHRLMCHIEDAGWKIVDTFCWLYGEGCPKSQDFSKDIAQYSSHGNLSGRFHGRGTSLKPAWEPIILAIKPVNGSFAKTAAVFGCGGLNIDESRIDSNGVEQNGKGRWPANLMLDEDAAVLLDEQSGWSRSTQGKRRSARSLPGNGRTMGYYRFRLDSDAGYEDEGGASRFFYVAKAKGKERKGNDHPAVKPVTLCEYLARIILPPERKTPRRLLVSFSGSGSEMIGAINAGWEHVRGIEKSKKYAKLSRERLNRNSSNSIITQDQSPKTGSELKINTITKGDCAKVIPRLPDKAINLVLCSPPYANQRKGMYPGVSEESFPLFTVDWMSKLWDKLADDGSVLMVIRPHLKKGVISDYVLKTRLALRKYGWYECEELIWYKPDGGRCQGSNRRPRRAYESILWFSRSHNPFIETKACGEWSEDISFRGSTRYGTGSDLPVHTGQNTDKQSGRTRITDVVTVPIGTMAKGVMHPAMFPQPLAEKLIKTFSPEGGTVLDCFAGSGTTLLAAKATRRNYYGVDVKKEYVELARRRLDGDSSQAV